MCINFHQKDRASDSTSNMNSLSTSPLMCLVINEHINTEMVYAGCDELPEDLFFVEATNAWKLNRL